MALKEKGFKRGFSQAWFATTLFLLLLLFSLLTQVTYAQEGEGQASVNSTAVNSGSVNSTGLTNGTAEVGNGTAEVGNGTADSENMNQSNGTTDNEAPSDTSSGKTEDEFGQSINTITQDIENTVTVNGCNLFSGLQGCGPAVTTSDVTASAAINAVLGLGCFLLFGALRGKIKVYRARLASPATTVKPPKLPEGGVLQLVSWILPVLRMSDESLLLTAGLDALMFTRFLQMCVQFFMPVTLISVGVLLPIHYISQDGLNACEYENVIITDKLLRTTLSSVCPKDTILWVHFVYIYMVLAWAMWLLQKHYVAYASLRHHYIGLPQKPNYWFEKFLQGNQSSPQSAGGGEEQDSYLSPRDTLSEINEEDPMGNGAGAGSPHTPVNTESSLKRSESKGFLFSVSSWKNVALQWIKPEKVLNYKGEEPESLQLFSTSKIETPESVRQLKISKFNGEPESMRFIATSASIRDPNTPREYSGKEKNSLESQNSFAALKWWDVYTETYQGSKKNMYQREVMVRPSVRHIKGVNSLHEGLMVSVNASQYAILVSDIPSKSAQLNSLRRSFTGETQSNHSRNSTFDEDDEDTAKLVNPKGDICAEVFKQIFPDSFKCVVPVQDFSEVTKFLLQWDRASQKLEILEALHRLNGIRPMMKTGFLGLWGERVDSITHYEDLVERLSKKIKVARRKAKRSKNARCSFVIFNNQIDAAAAAQSVVMPLDGTKFKTHRAPGPDNINWLTLFKTSKQKFGRKLAVLPIIIIMMLFPAGLFSGVMGVLEVSLCQNEGQLYWEWYCTTNSQIGTLLKRLITGWIPSLLVAIWQNVVVTRTWYMVSLVECVSFSLSGVDKRITSLYFYWDFFNIFLGSVLGSSLFAFFGNAIALTDIRAVLDTLGQAIATSSIFLTNYVLLRTLFLVPMKLFFPHPGILNYVLRNVLSVTCFKGMNITRRQRYQAWEPKSFMYGREAGTALLMTLIGVVYIATSPITVAIVAFYFIFMYVVCRHHILYVYARNYESGGELWPLLFDRFIIMLISLAYFTACQLITKQAIIQAVIIFITTPIILYKFHSVCTKRYKDISLHVPLDIAWRQPKADVPPQMYIPSELRSQSVGWHPEQGKAWSGYGMPRWL